MHAHVPTYVVSSSELLFNLYLNGLRFECLGFQGSQFYWALELQLLMSRPQWLDFLFWECKPEGFEL